MTERGYFYKYSIVNPGFAGLGFDVMLIIPFSLRFYGLTSFEEWRKLA